MKQVSHRGYLLVECPENTKTVWIMKSVWRGLVFELNGGGRINTGEQDFLPKGDWQVQGLVVDLTKETQNYFKPLLKTKGLSPQTTLILKLKTNE